MLRAEHGTEPSPTSGHSLGDRRSLLVGRRIWLSLSGRHSPFVDEYTVGGHILTIRKGNADRSRHSRDAPQPGGDVQIALGLDHDVYTLIVIGGDGREAEAEATRQLAAQVEGRPGSAP